MACRRSGRIGRDGLPRFPRCLRLFRWACLVIGRAIRVEATLVDDASRRCPDGGLDGRYKSHAVGTCAERVVMGLGGAEITET